MLKKLFGTYSSDSTRNRQSQNTKNRSDKLLYPLCVGSDAQSPFNESLSGSSVLSNSSPTSAHQHNIHRNYSHRSGSASTSSLFSTISSSSTPLVSSNDPPFSIIDEVDTRNLLYGTTNIESTNLANINRLKDIRVVVISDVERLDIPFYDSSLNAQDFDYPARRSSISSPTQQRRSSLSSSPAFKLPNIISNQKYAAEIPNFASLQTRVFGHSHMKYSGPVTKLHPLPFTEVTQPDNCTSSNTTTSNARNHDHNSSSSSKGSKLSSNSPKQIWLISRIFKLSRGDNTISISTASTSTTTSPYSSNSIQDSLTKRLSFGINKSLKKQNHGNTCSKNDYYNNTSNSSDISRDCKSLDRSSASNSSSPVGPTKSDYNVAICIFISVPHDCQSNITDYWEELSAALLQLQTTVSSELASNLPLLTRDFVPSTPDTIRPFNRTKKVQSYNGTHPPYQSQHTSSCLPRKNFWRYSLSGSQTIKHAIEVFRDRFLISVRVPRVVCGQKKWSELVDIFEWALLLFGSNSEKFLFSIISTFVLTNIELLSVDLRSFPVTALGSPPTRTVVIGDRITSRKIIFLLTSLINDSFGEIYHEQKHEVNLLNSFENGNVNGAEPIDLSNFIQSPATNTNLPVTDKNDNQEDVSLFPSKTKTPEPCISPLADDAGWACEMTAQTMPAETSSVCTMSHMFLPHTENSSVSSALSMAINESASSSLTCSNTYDSTAPSSINTQNSKGLNIFESLGKASNFSFNSIRNSLASVTAKKQQSDHTRRLSASRCHEDIMFHISTGFAGDNFLSKNTHFTLEKKLASTSFSNSEFEKTSQSSWTHDYSSTSSSNTILLSNNITHELEFEIKGRTATTLPQLPQLKRCLDLGIFETDISNCKRSYSTQLPPELTQREPEVDSSISFPGRVSKSTEQNLIPQTTKNLKSSTNEPNDFAHFFKSADGFSNSFYQFACLNKSLNGKNDHESSANSSNQSANSCFSHESALTYESVELPDKSASCIDVSPFEPSDMNKFGSRFFEPIILPPIVGHIRGFHPDFAVQACSPSEDLDNKITQAMLQDSLAFKFNEADYTSTIASSANLDSQNIQNPKINTNNSSIAASLYAPPFKSTGLSNVISDASCFEIPDTESYDNAKEIISKTLVIDLQNREIVEHILIRDTDTQHVIYRNKLFSENKPITPAVSEGMTIVESQLSSLINNTLKNSKASDLILHFESHLQDGDSKESNDTFVNNDGIDETGQIGNSRTSMMCWNQKETQISTEPTEFSKTLQFQDILKKCYESRFNLLKF